MGLKEFLKPTKGKIIVCISLLVLAFLLPLLAGPFKTGDCIAEVGYKCTQPLFVRILNGISDFLRLPQYPVIITLYLLGVETEAISLPVFIVIDIVYLYLLASTIIFVANKIKKK